MKLPYTGGCACGAVRYECSAVPVAMFRCHCRDCQRIGGGPFAAALLVEKDAFKVTQGELRHYSTESIAFGDNRRGFCGDCGSPITGRETDERIGIVAGSLDDSTWFRPQMDIHTADAQPWDRLDPDVPKFEEYPPSVRR